MSWRPHYLVYNAVPLLLVVALVYLALVGDNGLGRWFALGPV